MFHLFTAYFPPHIPPPTTNTSFNEHPPFSYDSTPTASSYTDSQSGWDRYVIQAYDENSQCLVVFFFLKFRPSDIF